MNLKLPIAIFFLVFLQGCAGLFYFPTDRLYVNVKKLETQPQQIELTTSDDKKFFGWYFKASEKPKGKILFFHGNAQNRTAHFFALYWILKENYDFFIFDYPGYGESDGTPNQKSTTDSGQKALEWIAKQNPDVPLIIFGQSLGGNIALYTAAKNKSITTCLVAIDSSFKSYRKVAQRKMAEHWFFWPFQGLAFVLIGDSYSAETHIAEIAPTPVLFFHGDDDSVVDIQNGRDAFAAALEPKNFYVVPGKGHTMAFNGIHQEEFRKIFLKEIKKDCP